jgi:hypothetical protein
MSDAFEDFDRGTVFGLTIYSYISGLACLAGAVGVFKVNNHFKGGGRREPRI